MKTIYSLAAALIAVSLTVSGLIDVAQPAPAACDNVFVSSSCAFHLLAILDPRRRLSNVDNS